MATRVGALQRALVGGEGGGGHTPACALLLATIQGRMQGGACRPLAIAAMEAPAGGKITFSDASLLCFVIMKAKQSFQKSETFKRFIIL